MSKLDPSLREIQAHTQKASIELLAFTTTYDHHRLEHYQQASLALALRCVQDAMKYLEAARVNSR
jgi:hypothetical protein